MNETKIDEIYLTLLRKINKILKEAEEELKKLK